MCMQIPADLIIENVTVLTMDPLNPTAHGIIIKKDKIIGLLDSDTKNWLLAPDGKRLDGKGMFLLPGLIDAHCHLRAELSKSLSVPCGKEDVSSIPELIAAIRHRALQTPHQEWIRATGYDPFYLEEKRNPTFKELDSATANHPVRLRHVTRHASVLNSYALRLAGINRHSTDPPGVKVDRDPVSNEPTGVVYGADHWLSKHVISPSKPSEWLTSANQLQSYLLSCGITALIDATPTNTVADLDFWLTQMKNGWPLVLQFMGEEEQHTELSKFHKNKVPDSFRKQLEIGPIKVVMEATPDLYPDLEELTRIATVATRNNASLAIHVVNPEMIWAAVEAIRQVKEILPQSRSIYRLEHLSLCPDAFLDDLKNLNIVVVTNPSFIREHGDRYLSAVDSSEHAWLYRTKSLLDKGIPLAAGSDAPVSSFNPWKGIYSAINRNTLSGQTVAVEEKINRFQSLQMYTSGAAYSAGWQDCRGMLRPGMQADFILLHENPLNCPKEHLIKMKAAQTWIGGTLVYEAY